MGIKKMRLFLAHESVYWININTVMKKKHCKTVFNMHSISKYTVT